MGKYPQIPATIYERRELLYKELRKAGNKTVFCPAINRRVKILPESITETAFHASKSVVSTKLALRIRYIISNAKIVQSGIKPKTGTQTKKFHFKELIILSCGIRGLGTAKLTIGLKPRKQYIEYCITDIRCHNKETSLLFP